MSLRAFGIGVLAAAILLVGGLFAMNALRSTATLQQGRPALVAVPPLQPLAGTSTVLAPAAIAMSAIRDALEKQTLPSTDGSQQVPVSPILGNADVNWTITRGPLDVSGRADAIVLAAQIAGTIEAKGQIKAPPGGLGGPPGNMLGGGSPPGFGPPPGFKPPPGFGPPGFGPPGFGPPPGLGPPPGGRNSGSPTDQAGQAFDQHADIRGSVTVGARPTVAPNWRLTPNLSTQINLADIVLPIAGVQLSLGTVVKPFFDTAVRAQTAALESRLRNDPFIENAARDQWSKLCQAIPLGAAGQGAPNLWLEIRPTRAIAAQPKIDANAVTLLVGVQAETRIMPTETRPVCQFPQQLEIVPQESEGTFSIGIPIDIPFTEVNRLLEAQIKDRTFPEDGSGSNAITVRQVAVAASGDRLLVSLVVNAKRRGLFSFAADWTVHVWGRPVLDQNRQVLRLADVALDVQSEAAVGLLGAAARAAVPLLQREISERAVIDLKPLADDAKKRTATAVGDFNKQGNGVSADVAVRDIRLVGIDFDDKTLRVIAEAYGSVSIAVSSLSVQ
jgi:Domain of unknown function (DUF4403)